MREAKMDPLGRGGPQFSYHQSQFHHFNKLMPLQMNSLYCTKRPTLSLRYHYPQLASNEMDSQMSPTLVPPTNF